MSKYLSPYVRLFALFALVALTGCTTVPPGEVGIAVNKWGSNRGVEDYPLQTGAVMYNPFSTTVYTYPTTMQSVVWTVDAKEGPSSDESITFNSIEGAMVNADVGLTYSISPDKVPALFVKFKQDADRLTHGYLRQQVRDEFTRRASKMPVAAIYGEGKQQLIDSVLGDLRRRLGPMGINIDNVSLVGAFRVDRGVAESINRTIQAKNDAISAENKVRQAEAEAAQRAASAKGFADSVTIVTKAQAEANRELNSSLSPTLVRWQMIQKWDGAMPKVAGANPMVMVGGVE
jgi:regulator of protease activity HflC (stomatin/prohibitin superfamily)